MEPETLDIPITATLEVQASGLMADIDMITESMFPDDMIDYEWAHDAQMEVLRTLAVYGNKALTRDIIDGCPSQAVNLLTEVGTVNWRKWVAVTGPLLLAGALKVSYARDNDGTTLYWIGSNT